ncbi:MAG: hypothetical protein KBT40_04490 [bacterium]|nr:hypothetical protein [Candidatus Minthenecus merdequi]
MICCLDNNAIDRTKWDKLVSVSGQPYALSWWLDIVSPKWKALVEDDYQAVMPLPVKRRFGITYLVQPRFTQQLGLFGDGDINAFLRKIPYLSYDFNLNYTNSYNGSHSLTHINYIMDGSKGPDNNTQRNVKRSQNLEYKPINVETFMDFWTQHNGHLADPQLLKSLINSCNEHNMSRIDAAYFEERIVSALFSICTTSRYVTLAPVSSPEGLQCRAMFGLMSRLIEQRGERIIDFEGSMIPGVARFYRGLGGVEQPHLRIWRLSPRKKN